MSKHPLPAEARYAASIANIPMPPDIARLPIHPKLRMPLPWFCQQDPPDFRIIRPGAMVEAHRGKLCWITGLPRFEKRMAFVVGPMCVISGTSAELPSRIEPARYAAHACPFLANPKMKRNGANMPEDTIPGAGIMIERNPGVVAILVTDSYEPFAPRGGQEGVLIAMGEPLWVEWYAEGRPATREEVDRSIETGLPALRELAARDGEAGMAALEERLQVTERWLPPRVPALVS